MKKILFTLAALSLTSFSFAQEFDFGGSDSGDFGGSIEESSAPAVTISGEVGADARAWIGAENKETGRYDTKAYDSFYDFSKTLIDAKAHANVELNYAGDYTDANIKFKLNPSTLKKYQEDIIDEVSLGGSFKEGRFQIRAGKMKEVWGKGDKVHVLDNFNANDYTDFIFPDYIDRRLGEVMFKATANLSWDYNIKLEGIFTPWMTADRFADSGMLVPYAQTKLTDTVKSILKMQASTTYASGDTDAIVNGIMGLSEFSTDSLYEDNIRTLKYAQGGARLTGTLGGIDWGASYYYGHYKQPSANVQRYAIYSNSGSIKEGAWAKYYATAVAKFRAAAAAAGNDMSAYTDAQVYAAAQTGTLGAQAQAAAIDESKVKAAVDSELTANGYTLANALPSLNYDQLQVFGLEAAFVLWKLNTRWEFAYNLTEDIAGDNPWVKNNSIAWVAGFDIDIPLHNLNLNVQEQGSYILKNDKIENNKVTVGTLAGQPIEVPIGTADVDYNSDGKYTRNKIIVLLSDKWLNEKLTTEVQGIYGIECQEFMVAPKIEYNVIEGLTFGLRGVYLFSDNVNGEFYNFTQNSENHNKVFVELTAKYQF
ncbi:hypothetical protein [Treponema sp.]|uniref:hypothetical protein n=1 Tax=Treponema sp. TaxID=166 RepID=UPI0025DFE655|nr:hypothetical protein [Treponema sp.]MBR4321423.1 hypothetical protein [Treponema sp.]